MIYFYCLISIKIISKVWKKSLIHVRLWASYLDGMMLMNKPESMITIGQKRVNFLFRAIGCIIFGKPFGWLSNLMAQSGNFTIWNGFVPINSGIFSSGRCEEFSIFDGLSTNDVSRYNAWTIVLHHTLFLFVHWITWTQFMKIHYFTWFMNK